MAYAALASLARTIDRILNYRQDSVSPQVENQIISINEYVIFLQTFLEDFPDRATRLEGRIRKLTHIAEDVIEFLLSDALIMSTVGSSKATFTDLPYGFHELKEVTEKIEWIAEKVMQIKNSVTGKDVQPDDSTAASSSSRVGPVHKEAMVGFDNDILEIKSRLCRESSNLEIIPIVGMGGIGKTTLARNIYDDPLIMEHFQIRVWVTVSQDHCVQEIASGLLISMKVFDAKNESTAEHHVYQNLKGRRYLVVLDDIWSIKAWDDLKMMFPNDGNGSRILLTTRLLDVASYADPHSPVHEMRLMDKDQSWSLLRKKVFKQEPCPVELEYVGKMIARSCKGLPLAIVVISGLLTVRQTESAWLNIAKVVKSAISANDEQFEKMLSLSYKHLPYHLRPCFLYMAGFPEDYKMRVSKLIKLWVAEGFVKPNVSKSFEETAKEYLEELVKRNLILVTKRKSNGGIKSLSIHDLMREMCIRKARKEKLFRHIRWYPQGIKSRRHVSNFYDSTIRTIIILKRGDGQVALGIRNFLGYFRSLRILDLVNVHSLFHKNDNAVPSFPDEVFELFHLRYLALGFLFPIPAAISNLQNLQVLVVYPRKVLQISGGIIVSLPQEIWLMPQLRHILFHYCVFPREGRATCALENLQTLSAAINFVCSETILKMIPNLKKLEISYKWIANEGKYEEDYQLHNLVYLQQLENLKLKIYKDCPCRRKVSPAFPRTLKKLTMSGWGRPWKDLKIVGSLPKLQVLKLRDFTCVGTTWETTEGEFSQLKFLLIEKSHLEHWITESSHFPRLKCLVLYHCWYLREIPDDIGEIPTLELIEVDNQNKSLVNSVKQIQDDQQSNGNDALQVRFAYKR